jgi:hypothetical protein
MYRTFIVKRSYFSFKIEVFTRIACIYTFISGYLLAEYLSIDPTGIYILLAFRHLNAIKVLFKVLCINTHNYSPF